LQRQKLPAFGTRYNIGKEFLHVFSTITDMQILFENIPNFSEESLTIPNREFNNKM